MRQVDGGSLLVASRMMWTPVLPAFPIAELCAKTQRTITRIATHHLEIRLGCGHVELPRA
jgi:hypothetical protein